MSHRQYTPISSDHLDSVHYDSMERKMYIQFKNGSEYAVHGFLPADHQAFMDAPSQGVYFHSVIKPNFFIERVK